MPSALVFVLFCFVCLFVCQDSIGCLSSFVVLHKFLDCSLYFCETFHFDRNCIESVDCCE